MSDLIVDLSDELEPGFENDLPSYSDVGHILVSVGVELERKHSWGRKHEYEVLDSSGCAFWINEGEGFDYWLDHHCEFPGPGVYVVEGIVGTYYRGDGYTTDDDVRWEFTGIRQATEEETRTETVTA